MMKSYKNSKFSKAKDYTISLSKLSFFYTINGKENRLITSDIHRLDDAVLTYSVVKPSNGVFLKQKNENKDFLALRFIRKGYERHFFDQKSITLTSYSIGVFDLKKMSTYKRVHETEGINLFIEKTPANKVLLNNSASSRVFDASVGMAYYLLENMFTLESQLKYITKEQSTLLLNQLLRNLCNLAQQIDESNFTKETTDLIESAANYIYTYIENPDLSLEYTAKYCHVSTRTLQKHFKKMGFSFSSYVNQLRLIIAAVKLFQTYLPVTLIAYQCGFSNSSYFSKRFKEKYGFSPSHYRSEKHKHFYSMYNKRIQCPLTSCTCQSIHSKQPLSS